ncbi:secreted protein, partial [Candidatus Omnitrophus magneticus]
MGAGKNFLSGCGSVYSFILFFSLSAGAGDTNKKCEWLGVKQEWAPNISAGTAFLTKYIWRGQNVGNDPVMQPDATISKWGLSASIWGNYDTGVND